MSDSDVAVRAIALSEAVKYSGGKELGVAPILAVAESFLGYLLGADVKAAPAKSTKITKGADSAPKTKVEVPEGPTKEDIGKVVQNMLDTNKRAEAVALMKKFGAASVSTLKETDYAAFIEKADAILMTA